MPWRVSATSSGSAYDSRIVSSRSGPRASASRTAASEAYLRWSASASFSCASAIFARASASLFTFASTTLACASRSFVSCSVVTMRRTLPLSSFCNPRVSRMVSSACSHGTLRRAIDILPFTSSPTTMFRPLSAARMRSRFTTSASLKSREISRRPLWTEIEFDGGAGGVVGAVVGACATRNGSGFDAASGLVVSSAFGAGTALAICAGAAGSGSTGGVRVAGAGASGAAPGGVCARAVGAAGSIFGVGFAGAAGIADATRADGLPASAITMPSPASVMVNFAGFASSMTRRVMPLRYWLPRISLMRSVAPGSGVFRHSYCVPSKSTTSRRGSMSDAWYLGTLPVFTVTLVASSLALTLTSVRRAVVSAPAPATQINITATSPMRRFGMLISR